MQRRCCAAQWRMCTIDQTSAQRRCNVQGVNHDRIREISTRCLAFVTSKELDGYPKRNDRLRELCKELNELG